MSTKLVKGNAILAKVRHFVSNKTLINTYNAYIQLHIDYGLNIWGYSARCHLNLIESQQRKSIRIMNFKKRDYDQTNSLFKSSKILPLLKLRDLNSCKLIWKARKSLLPPALNSLFSNRQFNSSLHVPYRRIETTQCCTSYLGAQTWNKISNDIRNSPSINTFKASLKLSLISSL